MRRQQIILTRVIRGLKMGLAEAGVGSQHFNQNLLATMQMLTRLSRTLNKAKDTAEKLELGNVGELEELQHALANICLLYTSPSPRDRQKSRMPSSA